MSSQSIAAKIVASLNANGVKHFLLSPGSRSQALAIAASQLEQANLAKVLVRLDERSMAFTGLGISRASKSPVALIVTSGTAVANLFPAVLEAHHSGVPLILLTADRPARLRNRGANQTTNQVNIFGSAATCFDLSTDLTDSDAEQKAQTALELALRTNQPVQLNIQFDTPLSSANPNAADLVASSKTLKIVQQEKSVLEVPVDDYTVVIAGAGGHRAVEFAEQANLPLFAEPSSGARKGEHSVSQYLNSLNDLRQEVRKVVVFGKPTLSRVIQKLISESSVYVESNSQFGTFNPFDNVIGTADQLVPSGSGSKEWLTKWQRADELTERQKFVSFVWDQSDRLLLGASDLIRDLDGCAQAKELEVYSNRGLSGIDGSVSTGIGIAIANGPTTALIGDLTLLHDANGLNKTDLPDFDLRLVVGNDGGGHIFSRLEVADEVEKPVFERLFRTKQSVDIEALANAYGWKYIKCQSLPELLEAWKLSGAVLIDYQLAD